MADNLVVILGAGAAHDLIPQPSDRSIREEIYRPPLTKDLFLMHNNLEQFFSDFPGVESVLGDIRSLSKADGTAVSLEKYLRNLRESNDSFRRIQFRHFSPYLQKLFYLLTQRFCYQPVNYNRLLNETLGDRFRKVLYLTLNYDLLFDKALHSHPGTQFNINDESIAKYIPRDEKWSYIKLHGSVDWGKKIKTEQVKNPGRSLGSLIDNINQLGDSLEQALDDKILIGKSYDIGDSGLKYNPTDFDLTYPVLGVPVDGDSKACCDPNHTEYLQNYLNECQDFLVIGFSGIDKDVLDLLDKKNNGFRKVVIVTNSEDSSRDALMRFMDYGSLSQKLQTHIVPYGTGFSNFLDKDLLRKEFY